MVVLTILGIALTIVGTEDFGGKQKKLYFCSENEVETIKKPRDCYEKDANDDGCGADSTMQLPAGFGSCCQND